MSITDSPNAADFTAPPLAAHPLGSLTADEIDAVRDIVTRLGIVEGIVRFAYVGLEEPPKAAVLSWENGGERPERAARVQLLETATGKSVDAVVSLETGSLLSSSELDGRAGQLPILDAEFEEVGIIANEDARWVAALATRGLAVDDVVLVPLSAGHYGFPAEEGRRILRAFAFRQDYPADHPWAHPVDGLTAYIDATAGKVIEIVDTPGLEVPETSGNFDSPDEQGTPLEGLKPSEVSRSTKRGRI